MTHEPPADLQTPGNRQVLEYLRDKSAHSDVAQALDEALRPLGDVQVFCPDAARYRYLAASTRNVVFAAAYGMNTLAFRLDEDLAARAVRSGGEPAAPLGEEWVSFTLFRSDWPAPDLEFWARKAYALARGR